MTQRLCGILIEALLALMTVPSRGRVSTVGAHAARDALRQAKDFHIEATLPRVIIAIAACKRERERERHI